MIAVNKSKTSDCVQINLIYTPFSESEKTNLRLFNDFITTKRPSGCTVVEFPALSVCDGDSWSDASKDELFSRIKDCLNCQP